MPKIVQRPQVVQIRLPSNGTLRTYGLTAVEWLAILLKQGSVCAICKRVPKSGRWVTDHEHIPQFKKMRPEQRKLYVRGVICPFCNSHVVGRFVTLEKAINAVAYLRAYNRRRPKEHKPQKIKKG